jgi:SAM-dependent methyltransferase
MTYSSDIAFPFYNHLVMLSDKGRISSYEKAIDGVDLEKLTVLDVGSGTGVLSFMAHKKGAKYVVGLEKDFSTYNMVSQMLKNDNNAIQNFSYLNLSSFCYQGHDLTKYLVISELMGPVGLEEHIVEIFYDLKNRLGKILCFVPFMLDICYSFGFCAEVDQEYDAYLNTYKDHLPYLAKLKNQKLFEKMFSYTFSFRNFKNEYSQIEGGILKSYPLGYASSSALDVSLNIPFGANILCVFFKAHLNSKNNISISNYPGSETHWKTPFIRIPASSKQISLKYVPKNSFFFIDWFV